MIGQALAHYTILEKLGEGGMGVVYKARDTHLDRVVAIKVLPPEKVADPERKRRFVQEAKAASALNHPNIITIYDIDTADGVTFIAMEYVKGKTLDRLIHGKGTPLNETLKHGMQIADALAAAHAAGIIHRDIKPGNIMVTEAGLVKVLDFGLAKLTEIPESSEDQPTRTLKAETEEGVILGTIAYMSPEQAEGKPVDARSDIFSFGSLLYEMLTGRRAFSGETRVSTQAAILRQEPKSVSQVALETPRELERIVSRCLRKDPLRRFQHMDEVKIALEELKEESGSGSAVAVAPRRRRRSLLAAALAALVAAAAAWYWLSRPGPPASDLQPVPLTSSGIARWPSFSPDGNRVAFSWNGEKEDNFDIYEQQIGSNAPPLRLTSDPAQDMTPAWSPDDRYIAFVRQQGDGRALYLIPALGGPERKIAELAITPSWTPDSKWLAASLQDSPDGQRRSIWLISVETGERRRLTNPLAGLGDDYPAVSPDGRTLAFERQVKDYVSNLCALRLSRDFQPQGEPRILTNNRFSWVSGIAWTGDGREIVYSAGIGGTRTSHLFRLSVSGGRSPVRLPFAASGAVFPAIAGMHPRLAYAWQKLLVNLWRLDTRTGERKILVGSNSYQHLPQYSPDGRKIAFQSDRSGEHGLWTCTAEGSNCVELTTFGGTVGGTPRWSPDGRWIAFDSRAEGQAEIYVIQADGGAPRRITADPAGDHAPSWSHDGRWIYFASDRSGRVETWKIPAAGGAATQVTRTGGGPAFESADGEYVYYVKPPSMLRFQEATPLFRRPVEGGAETQILPRVWNWSLFGITAKAVYFAPDEKTLQRLDLSTRKVTTLATLEKALGVGICVSPDDAFVVWPQWDQNYSDLMLVEGFR